jgi:ribosome-associated translation inhibitor RaiA
MRIQFDGKGTALPPELPGDIAERLEILNAPYEDIIAALVTLRQLRTHRKPHHATRIELLLVGRTLCAMHEGTTLRDTVNAALADIARQLQTFRMLRPRMKVTPPCLDAKNPMRRGSTLG